MLHPIILYTAKCIAAVCHTCMANVPGLPCEFLQLNLCQLKLGVPIYLTHLSSNANSNSLTDHRQCDGQNADNVTGTVLYINFRKPCNCLAQHCIRNLECANQ